MSIYFKQLVFVYKFKQFILWPPRIKPGTFCAIQHILDNYIYVAANGRKDLQDEYAVVILLFESFDSHNNI